MPAVTSRLSGHAVSIPSATNIESAAGASRTAPPGTGPSVPRRAAANARRVPIEPSPMNPDQLTVDAFNARDHRGTVGAV